MPEVVALPGLDGTGALLAPLCSSLAARGISARAIGYPVDLPLDYDALERRVRAQLPAQAFVLLGESFSGPVALRIAADPPAGLRGLVLSTTFARSPVPLLRTLAGWSRFAPARVPMPILAWGLLGRWAQPALRSGLRTALAEVSPAVLRLRAAQALQVDVSALLPSIRVPVLNLVASADRLLDAAAGHELARGLSDCRTLRLDGPHLLLQAAPQACAEAVAGFAQGLAEAVRAP